MRITEVLVTVKLFLSRITVCVAHSASGMNTEYHQKAIQGEVTTLTDGTQVITHISTIFYLSVWMQICPSCPNGYRSLIESCKQVKKKTKTRALRGFVLMKFGHNVGMYREYNWNVSDKKVFSTAFTASDSGCREIKLNNTSLSSFVLSVPLPNHAVHRNRWEDQETDGRTLQVWFKGCF